MKINKKMDPATLVYLAALMASHFVQQMQQQPQVVAIQGFSLLQFLSNVSLGSFIARPRLILAAPFRIFRFLGHRLDLLPPQVAQQKFNFFIGTLDALKQNNFIQQRLVEGSTVIIFSPKATLLVKKVGDVLIIIIFSYLVYRLLLKLYLKTGYKKHREEIQQLRSEIRELRNKRY